MSSSSSSLPGEPTNPAAAAAAAHEPATFSQEAEAPDGTPPAANPSPAPDDPVAPPPPMRSSLRQLVKDHYDRTIHVHPRVLKEMNASQPLRDVRNEGVQRIKKTIKESGWAAQTPLIAHDESNGTRPPRLLEGCHRAEALFQLFQDKDTSWLLEGETPDSFRVEVTVLKGLSKENQLQLSRQANRITGSNVPMSLVDQVVAMHSALSNCKEKEGLPSREPVPLATLHKHHPDYLEYAKNTVRRWKQLAEDLGREAMKFMKMMQRVHEEKRIRRVFSTKTLTRSKFLKILRQEHGPQFWYIRRLAAIEREDSKRFRALPAQYFEDLAIHFKQVAEKLADFAVYISSSHRWLAMNLDRLAHEGAPVPDRECSEDRNYLQQRLLGDLMSDRILPKEYDATWKASFGAPPNSEDLHRFPYFLRDLVADAYDKEPLPEDDQVIFVEKVSTEGVSPSPEPEPEPETDSAAHGEWSSAQEGPPSKRRKIMATVAGEEEAASQEADSQEAGSQEEESQEEQPQEEGSIEYYEEILSEEEEEPQDEAQEAQEEPQFCTRRCPGP